VKNRPTSIRLLWRLFFCVVLAGPFPGIATGRAGNVKFDGSFGRNDALRGPNFQIPASAGRQNDANLFHSFSEFNLSAGEEGSFQGPSSVKNIIARVTGGTASSIDGTLRSEIQDANLYFLNPAGVMFGPNAHLDLNGSLIVSTADYVKLRDGGTFHTHLGGNNLLTSAPVSAFGFTNPKPAAVTVDRTQLFSAIGAGLHLIGGDISLDGAALQAPSGFITLFGARSSGVVAFDLYAPGAGYRTAAFGSLGNIAVAKSSKSDGSSTVNIDGSDGPGKIVIRGGHLAVSGGSSIRADNFGSDKAGGDVAIKVDRLSVSGELSLIEATTLGDGTGGNLQIDAGSVAISAGGKLLCETAGLGNAGKLTLNVDGSVTLAVGGGISTSTFSDGAGGRLDLTAENLLVTDRSIIISDNGTTNKARGGDLHIVVRDLLSLEKGGLISTDTYSAGNAGLVRVTAAKLRIDGAMSSVFTGIRSDVAPETDPESAAGITGHGGTVMIHAGEISVTSGGGFSGISASTYAPGNGGLVDLMATESLVVSQGGVIVVGTQGPGAGGTMRVQTLQLLLDGRNSQDSTSTGLIAQSKDRGSGRGGSIEVETGSLTMLGGAVIEATTGSESNAGSVNVTANRILLDGTGASLLGNSGLPLATAISARTLAGASGNGGDVSVTARETITLLNRGEIEAATEGAGQGGNVSVRAGSLFASGSSFGFPSGVVARGSDGARGAAGSVRVDLSGNLNLEKGAEISSSSFGAGDAGNVRVSARGAIMLSSGAALTVASTASNAGTLAVETSTDLALTGSSSITASAGRSGGNISLQARDLLYLRDSSITATAGTARGIGATVGGNGGNIFIDPTFIILDHGLISANASIGQGGNILLVAENFLPSETAITATGTTAGTVQITAPPLDLADALAALAGQFIDVSTRLQERCTMRLGVGASSLVVVGRGGVFAAPDEAQVETAGFRRDGKRTVRGR
jgi:filamentous hemagglutinin family protein